MSGSIHPGFTWLASCILLAASASVQAAPKPLKSAPLPVTPAAPTVRQFNTGVSKIISGTWGNFIVLFQSQGPTAALPIEENQQVWVPVSGQVGGVNVPPGSTLVGRLSRVDENAGMFTFETLIANNKIYPIRAVSTPVPGKLRADPYSLQTPRESKEIAAAQIGERRGIQQGRATRRYGWAGNNIANMAGGGVVGSAIGTLGSLLGGAQEDTAIDKSLAKQEEIMQRDVPTIMVANLAPLQNLSVQFISDVDLNAPVGDLPAGMQPGTFSLPNAPSTPSMAYPISPVGPGPSYPGRYYNNYPGGYPGPTPVYPSGYPSMPAYPGVPAYPGGYPSAPTYPGVPVYPGTYSNPYPR